MPAAPFIARLRAKVGNDLLVLPSVSVLPRDGAGRVLLVRIIDTGLWATVGGAVEPDESPQEAAVREAEEEAGVRVALGPVLAVLGGPEFRMTYPNGDRTAYVVSVFGAEVVGGEARPDGEETSAVRWWDPAELPYGEMGVITRAILRDVGIGRA
ncbi:MAG TPA: NUDIX domain-containing protein [Acidimicrobiales bacterium]|nr:NUDIX domain-containing protein [Acidimicrobiales bacterium]